MNTNVSDVPWLSHCAMPALTVPELNYVFCPGLTPKNKKKLGIWISTFLKIGWLLAQPRLEHYA